MKRLLFSALSVTGLIALSGTAAFAQSVISAHSGLIHYVEGRVLLDGKPVEVKLTSFPDVKENMELRTEDGRAEVLLNPGVFLRMGENTGIRMVANKLSDSQVEFLSGSAIIEASSQLIQKENSVTILYKGASAHLRKSGIYRFESEPAQLKVYSGEAEVDSGSNVLIVRTGKMVALDSLVAVEKFDTKDLDALNRWSERRGEYIAMANVSAAKYVSDSGTGWSNNGWYYNPFFGMYTYIPMGGMFYSPYGFPYYSPVYVHRVYQAPPGTNVGRNGFGRNAGVANTGYSSSTGYSAPASARTASVGAFGGSGASVGHAASGMGGMGGGARAGGGGGRSR